MLLSHRNTITMGDIRAPSMDWSHPDRASTYKLFKQKACMYFECKDTHLNKQVAHILLMTGDEGVRMYNSWGLPAEESKIPAVIWEKFDTQIEPKSSFRVERLTFQRMRQRIDESSDDFVSRLNNQANLCKFRERDERIVEQLTYGTKHAEVQKALLVQDETYTLAKALEACRIYDASEGHQRAFREIQGGEVTVPVHAVQQRGPPPALGDLCYNCGESRHRSSQGCPARTSTCNSCGTIGHWAKAKACPRKQPSRNNSRSGYRSKSRNRSPNGGRQRGPGRGGRSHGSDTRYDSRSVDAVQQAQYDDDDDDDSFAQVAYH